MSTEIEALLKQLLTVSIAIAPWLTGGLAGALLTYTLNQRASRKKQPHLRITTERVDYSIPAKDETLKALRVFYDGTSYECLALFQFKIENISDKTAKSTPFLFLAALMICKKATDRVKF